MELKYNVTGSDRKRLVTSMAKHLECSAKYLGMPTAAYQVDYFTVDKFGTVSFDGRTDSDEVEMLVEALLERGFMPKPSDVPDEDEPEEAGDSLSLSYPRKDISDAALENLRLLVASKESLIKKALGTDALPIEVTDEAVSFPWFAGFPQPEEISAYAHFTGKLIGMAKRRSASPPRTKTRTMRSMRSAASCSGSASSATSTRRRGRYCFATSPAAVLSRVATRRCRRWSSTSKRTSVSTTT